MKLKAFITKLCNEQQRKLPLEGITNIQNAAKTFKSRKPYTNARLQAKETILLLVYSSYLNASYYHPTFSFFVSRFLYLFF